ncbi:hypothetical protein HK096_001920, partial [Nowakowskiella sp. JEL0078]
GSKTLETVDSAQAFKRLRRVASESSDLETDFEQFEPVHTPEKTRDPSKKHTTPILNKNKPPRKPPRKSPRERRTPILTRTNITKVKSAVPKKRKEKIRAGNPFFIIEAEESDEDR